MKLAFVFTNYNNFKHTLNVSKSICAITTAPIIIVDNNSSDKEKAELKKLESDYSSVKVIFNDKNIGYFAGLNLGLEYLYKTSYSEDQKIIIGNNDLIFPHNFIENLIKIDHLFNKYAVLSPNIITLDNVHQNPHVIDKVSFLRNIVYDIFYSNYAISRFILFLIKNFGNKFQRKDFQSFEKAQIIYQGYGACYILGPLFFKYYRSLFSPTFLMGEEFFLAYQLKLQNLQLYYEPSVVVYHQDHASIGMVDSKIFWEISKKSHKIYRKYLKSYE
jgi:GT2 family glycosyltransferase